MSAPIHIEDIVKLPPEEVEAILEELGPVGCEELLYSWAFHARPDQLHPDLDTDWDTWLILAGRGWGKTRTGSETIRAVVEGGHAGRIALVAEDAGDARDVIVEGESGILACSPKQFRPKYEPSKRRLTWPNGAIATTYSADDPEALRGPQFDFAWLDELAKYRYAQETWDMLQFGMRLGRHPRAIITTTPRPIPLIRKLVDKKSTVTTRGSSYDNIANLAPVYRRNVLAQYEGTRLGRQEIYAELLNDVPGALWTQAMLDTAAHEGDLPEMRRIVVAVDPSGAGDDPEKHDEIGIVVGGVDVEGTFWLLADYTCSLSPAGWARRVSEAYHEWAADKVIAEANFGGGMVKGVIQAEDRNLPVKLVTASRGKSVRAEPIAALYEQGRVRHAHSMGKVENQMLAFTATGYVGDGSPDRADAAIWALTELALGKRQRRGVLN